MPGLKVQEPQAQGTSGLSGAGHAQWESPRTFQCQGRTDTSEWEHGAKIQEATSGRGESRMGLKCVPPRK